MKILMIQRGIKWTLVLIFSHTVKTKKILIKIENSREPVSTGCEVCGAKGSETPRIDKECCVIKITEIVKILITENLIFVGLESTNLIIMAFTF